MASGDFNGFDKWGYPIITDWNKTYITDPVDEDENNRCVNVRTPVYIASDGVTPVNHITTAAQFGGQDPSMLADYFRAYQNRLNYISFLASPCPAYHTDFRPQGLKCINMAERVHVYGTISGNVMTLDLVREGYQDPRRIQFMATYTPAWETGGDPIYLYNTVGLTPGWEVRPVANDLNVRALVKRITSIDFEYNKMYVELSCQLPNIAAGAISIWCQMHDVLGWTHVQPARPMWSTKHKTGWISLDELPENKIIELTGKDSGHCRISFPLADSFGRYQGTFKVIASYDADKPSSEIEDGVDITSYFCPEQHFTGDTLVNGGFGPKLYVSDADGYPATFIVLDHTEEMIRHYRVYYCPEIAAPDDNDSDTLARGLKSCYWNIRDWTESFGNTGLSFGTVDADNRHWYCKMAHYGADLSLYDSECHNTLCPFFLAMSSVGGWQYNINDMKKIWMGKNLFYVQVIPGNPTRIIGRGWGGVPSITWLAGQPKYYTTGLDVNSFDYADGNCMGWMDTSTTPYYTLRTGAVGENGSGVLAQSSSSLPTDYVGNTLEDGTDHADLMKDWTGWRAPGYTPPMPESGAGGWCDKYVQRLVFKTFTIRGIDMTAAKNNTLQTIDGHEVIHTVTDEDDFVTLQLAREYSSLDYFANYNGAFPGIQDQAKYIYSATWEGDVLTLQMSPGTDYWVTRYSGGAYLTTGMTVNIPESEKSLNYGANNFNSCFGMMERARKGATLGIVNAPGWYSNIRGVILQAQARGGDTYAGGPIGAAGEKTIQITAAGAWRPYLYGSGNENPIPWTLVSVKFGYNLETYGSVENIAYGNFIVSEGMPAHMVNSWNGVWLMPSLETMAAAINQYVLTNDIGKLQMEVTYQYEGDTEDRVTTGIPMYSWVEVGAPFVSVPCVVLPGVPDLTVDPIIKWRKFTYLEDDPWTGETSIQTDWSEAVLICDGLFTGEEARSILPAHGHYRIFTYNGATCLVMPVEYWGYDLEVTMTYQESGLIYPETDPTGAPGIPDLGENRLKMDVIKVWFGGSNGQQLKTWMQSFTPFPSMTYKIVVDETAVMPPEKYYNADGELIDVTPDLNIYHVEYTSDNQVTNGGGDGVALVPSSYDRTHGIFTFDSTEWPKTGLQGIRFEQTAFLESFPHLLPKEVLTYAEEAIRQLKWFALSTAGDAYFCSLVMVNPEEPEYAFIPTWQIVMTPSTSWTGRDGLFGIVMPSYIGNDYTDAYVQIEEPENFSSGMFLANPYDANDDIYTYSSLNVIALTTLPDIGRTLSQYISAVKIDFTLTNPSVIDSWRTMTGAGEFGEPIWETGSEEADLIVSVKIGIATFVDGELTALTDTAYSDAVELVEIDENTKGGSLIADSGTFDVDLQPGQAFVVWVSGPTTSPTVGCNSMFDTWTLACSGSINSSSQFSSYTWRGRVLTYEGVGVSGVAVKLNHTAIETDAIEVVQGNFPPLINPA